MKSFVFFMLLSGCALLENKSEPPKTESDAKLVSPYSVKPCYCMKMFRPVCADNVTYGNSCEAECYGHKTWTLGSCQENTIKKTK